MIENDDEMRIHWHDHAAGYPWYSGPRVPVTPGRTDTPRDTAVHDGTTWNTRATYWPQVLTHQSRIPRRDRLAVIAVLAFCVITDGLTLSMIGWLTS